MEEDCIFCRIAAKKEPASIIYEDDKFLAFMDIRPVNMGHALVITKKHYEDILEMPKKEVGELFKIVKDIAVKVKKTTNADGITIMQKNGEAALQHIFHMHVHIIPRFGKEKVSDAFVSLMKPLLKKPKTTELESVAKRIRKERQ